MIPHPLNSAPWKRPSPLLSSRPEESWAAPTQGDEKRLLFINYCPWKHRPPLCHLDRSAAKWRDLRFSGPSLEMFFLQRNHGLRPPKVMKNGSCSSTTL